TGVNNTGGQVAVIAVNPVTGALSLNQPLINITPDGLPAFIAFSKDDTLALIGGNSFPSSVVVFCVTDRTCCTTPIQTISSDALMYGVQFAPCSDNAAITIAPDFINPGSVQVYTVQDEVCPSSCP